MKSKERFLLTIHKNIPDPFAPGRFDAIKSL